MGNCLSCILPKKKVPQTDGSSKREPGTDNERERLLKDVKKEDSGDHGSGVVAADVTDSSQRISDDKQTSHTVEFNGVASKNRADQNEHDKRKSLNEFVFSGDINDIRHIDSVLSVVEERPTTDSTDDPSLLKSMFKSMDPNNQQSSDNSATSGQTKPKEEYSTSEIPKETNVSTTENIANSMLPTITAGEVKDLSISSSNASETESAKVPVEPVVNTDRDDIEVEERFERMESKSSVGELEGSLPKQKSDDRPGLTEFLQTLENCHEDERVTDFEFLTRKLLSENQLKRDSDISIGPENEEKLFPTVLDKDIESGESTLLKAQARNVEEDDNKSESHHENQTLPSTETLSELQDCTRAADPEDIIKKHGIDIKYEDQDHKIDNTESHSDKPHSEVSGEDEEYKSKVLDSEHSPVKNKELGDSEMHESILNQGANENATPDDDVTDETCGDRNTEKNNIGEGVKTQDGEKQNDNLLEKVTLHSLDEPESLWSILSALPTFGTPNTESSLKRPENEEEKAETVKHTSRAPDASETAKEFKSQKIKENLMYC